MKKFLSLPPVSFAVEAAELFLEVGASRAAARAASMASGFRASSSG